MSTVTFGDLLFAADGHLEAAATRWPDPDNGLAAAARQLRRVVDVVRRHLDGVAP